MSYLINNGNVVAETLEKLKSGDEVLYSAQHSAEQIDASREFNLVNARTARVSNAKKWESSNVDFATEINPGEYLI